MPPKEEEQPEADLLSGVLETLQERLISRRPSNPLKRLTPFGVYNTIRDLFGLDFNFSGLLPPDHVEQGFDKFGEAHLMSPHQVMSYLTTARFICQQCCPC